MPIGQCYHPISTYLEEIWNMNKFTVLCKIWNFSVLRRSKILLKYLSIWVWSNQTIPLPVMSQNILSSAALTEDHLYFLRRSWETISWHCIFVGQVKKHYSKSCYFLGSLHKIWFLQLCGCVWKANFFSIQTRMWHCICASPWTILSFHRILHSIFYKSYASSWSRDWALPPKNWNEFLVAAEHLGLHSNPFSRSSKWSNLIPSSSAVWPGPSLTLVDRVCNKLSLLHSLRYSMFTPWNSWSSNIDGGWAWHP